jgi:pimeloyl-ACP methyl ester carboxylesterase
MIHYRTAAVGDHQIFYREAGDPSQTSLLLLHGFPSSSHMFRNLI